MPTTPVEYRRGTDTFHKANLFITVITKKLPDLNVAYTKSLEDILRKIVREELKLTGQSVRSTALQHLEEYRLFNQEFRNDRTTLAIGWNGREGQAVSAYTTNGNNYNNAMALYGASLQLPVGDRWRFKYDLTKLDMVPAPEAETRSTLIHLFQTSYVINPDMQAKLFFKTDSAINKEDIQATWTWRIVPHFGSLQLAYRQHVLDQDQGSGKQHSIFSRLAWVF